MNHTRIYKRSTDWFAVTRHDDGTTTTKRFRSGHAAMIELDRRNITAEDFRQAMGLAREIGRAYVQMFRRVGAAFAARSPAPNGRASGPHVRFRIPDDGARPINPTPGAYSVTRGGMR